MIFRQDMLRLYAVTDRAWVGKRSLEEQVEEALRGGVTMVQLREKNMRREDLAALASRLTARCHGYGVPLIVDDDVEAALEAGADGVHVGAEDLGVAEVRRRAGKPFIVGATAKTPEQAKEAERAGADYLGVGAVFPSPTKTNAIRVTIPLLREIVRSVKIPSVAIGGITAENATALAGSGIRGVAVVSSLFSSDDIRRAAERLRSAADFAALLPFDTAFRTDLPRALSIAGSDSSGGAGIEADIKTMTANGVYASCAVTALTAQNTTGVFGIEETSPAFLKSELDAVFTDIFPDAVKIGMIGAAPLVRTVAEALRQYRPKNVILDPVMVSTSGARLLREDAVETLKTVLLPLADLVTPNLPEAEILSGISIRSKEDVARAAKTIYDACGCAVLLKGGHGLHDADDLLYDGKTVRIFYGERIDNQNTHGTGCTLSSAIAANLAKGYALTESVARAKDYLSGALAAQLDLGAGSGPLNHLYDLKSRFIS